MRKKGEGLKIEVTSTQKVKSSIEYTPTIFSFLLFVTFPSISLLSRCLCLNIL